MNQKATIRRASSRSSILYYEEDFETRMVDVFQRFHNPIPVIIIKEYERRRSKIVPASVTTGHTLNVIAKRSQKKPLMKTTYKHIALANVLSGTTESMVTVIDNDVTEEITLSITTSYNSHNHLSAIQITKFQEETIPRDTIHLLALVLPNYQKLRKFTIKQCRIDRYVVHEIAKMLPYTTITDVCLDDCPLKQANYDELLQNTTVLKNLSLCRCNINDAMCEQMAARLHYLESAENSLVTLNLSSNRIGDEGAKYFAEALRSNRHLRYLNLADNLITDEGVSHICNILIEFPLTYDENINRRQRFMVYLKKKLEVNKEYLRQLSLPLKSAEKRISSASRIRSLEKIHAQPKRSSSSHSQIQRKVKKRDSAKSLSVSMLTLSEDNLPKKAELISGEMVGPFVDPFCPSCVTVEENPRCVGNFVLCYLNLAYNELTVASIRKLLTVVEYQRCHYTSDVCGLIKVVLEGNFLPVACTELMVLQKMLKKHVKCLQRK